MTTFRRFVSAFSLVFVLAASACSSSIVGTDDCGEDTEDCGITVTHGSDN